ncbi:MAG: alpha/beta fold hydrolase [Caulobacterales bacterium]
MERGEGKLQRRRLIFLPGVGADPNFWRPLGDRLPADWEKVYLGWPGLGDQPPDPSVTGKGDLIRLVEEQLGEGPCDLLAQSMGGVIAIAVTLRHPAKIRRLVLATTSGGIDTAGLGASDWREGYRRENPHVPAWVFEPWGDFTGQIPTITQPALLIWGDADPISPPAVGRRLAELLPDARLRVLPGGTHGLVEERPAEITPWIAQHLA